MSSSETRQINQDLQASYQIISLLERSKANSEAILDALPDLFLVIEEDGRILKGNVAASLRLAVGIERLLGQSIVRLFQNETWHLFESYLKRARELRPGAKPLEFELPIDKVEGEERICYWTISPLESGTRHKARLYCLVGRDITLLRNYQKQLAEIFASIPLAILTADREGAIEKTFSAYTQWLLGTDEIAGKTLKELLFEPAKEGLDAAAREGWESLLNYPNFSLREFDMLSETFPKQFYFPLPPSSPEKGRYLGLKVQSIARGQRISGLLLILEDRTAIVEAEKADEKQRLLLDQSLERALQIKRCDPDLLGVVLDDLKGNFSTLGDAAFAQNLQTFLNTLHGVKGNARLGGFTELIKLTHALESRIKEIHSAPGFKPQDFDWKMIHEPVDGIRHEWKEIVSLVTVMRKPSEGDGRSEGASDAQEAAAKAAAPRDLDAEISLHQLFMQLKATLSGNTPLAAETVQASLDTLQRMERKIVAASFKPLSQLEIAMRHNTQLTAGSLSKKVRLALEWNKEQLIDESCITRIRTCLIHLINNAIDHGIEPPEKRMELNKPLTGNIRVNAFQAGNRFVFTVEDDGRGLDTDHILATAISKGVLTAQQGASLTSDQICDLLFRPGFSTAEKVTEISGRGVGLEAVREIAHSLGGDVQARAGAQGGAVFQLHIRMDAVHDSLAAR